MKFAKLEVVVLNPSMWRHPMQTMIDQRLSGKDEVIDLLLYDTQGNYFSRPATTYLHNPCGKHVCKPSLGRHPLRHSLPNTRDTIRIRKLISYPVSI